jgi:hypothetical protein
MTYLCHVFSRDGFTDDEEEIVGYNLNGNELLSDYAALIKLQKNPNGVLGFFVIIVIFFVKRESKELIA